MWSKLSCILLFVVSAQLTADELVQADGVELIKAHCVACHSLQLIMQHRMNRSSWLESIRYMQKYHNLWPLGQHEQPILDYLVTHYGPRSSSKRRRANLPYIDHD